MVHRESSHAWRGLQMSEDPKRKSERKHEKQPFLARGEEGRKKERPSGANDFLHAVDGCEREEGMPNWLHRRQAGYRHIQRSQHHKDNKNGGKYVS